MMRDLPAVELSHWLVPDADYDLAAASSYFAMKRARIRGLEFVGLKWFEPQVDRLGQIDEERRTLWLSGELIGNPTELLRTVGHEVQHLSDHDKGFLFSEGSANVAGEVLLKAWRQRTAELEAKAAEREAKAAALAGRAFQRHFPGGSDFPVRLHAHLELPADPPTRPSWGVSDRPERE